MAKKIKLTESKDLAFYISDLLLQKKAEDIQIFDLREKTPVSDFFVICTASSDIHCKALADFVSVETKKHGENSWHSEGYTNLSWILLDYVNVVVHIFLKETRAFYNLEGLWGDAPITKIHD
ncbi:MAG TPA: ribosome silencing factor [Ignavibacteria bacterium]|nr:ribosome silencing factor [Ignavibacteria bacterium]